MLGIIELVTQQNINEMKSIVQTHIYLKLLTYKSTTISDCKRKKYLLIPFSSHSLYF